MTIFLLWHFYGTFAVSSCYNLIRFQGNKIMASSKEYLEYVLDLLRKVNGISYKKMMGEYILYKDNIIFGGIYDNRFLIKKTKTSDTLNLKEVIPYPASKGMYLVDSENPDEIEEIVLAITKDSKEN